MKYSTILLFGAPGAGKGTQGKILGTIPNFFHCACGDVFRNLTIDSELDASLSNIPAGANWFLTNTPFYSGEKISTPTSRPDDFTQTATHWSSTASHAV